VTERDPRERLRRALSFLERARRRAEPASVRQAEHALKSARAAVTRQASGHAKALRRALADQDRLAKRAAAGAIQPQEANETNRRLAARVQGLRGEVAELSALAAAQTSAQAGGFVDVPLDEYAGSRADGRPKIDLKPTPLGLCLWVVVLAAAIAGVLAYRGFIRLGPPVRIEAALDQNGVVRVVCRNRTPFAAAVHVAWPEGGSEQAETNEDTRRYGIVCRIRERGAKEERVVVPPLDAWVHGAMPLRAPEAITLGPGMSVELLLDTSAFLRVGAAPESLRLALTDANGRTAATTEVDLPDDQ